MILLGILWVLLPLLPSLLLVWILWPKENSFQPPFPFKVILALGLALGFSSMILLLYLEVAGSWRPMFLLVEIALTVIVSVFLVWRLVVRTPATDSPFRYPVEPRSLLSHLLWGGLCFVLSLAVINFAFWTINHSSGGWEALGNWNLRAAFLYRGGQHWQNVFSPLLESASSPMLLPCSIARVWHCVGKETQWAPSLLAMFFTFGAAGLLVTALYLLRGEIRGVLACVFLLGTTLWIRHGAYQQADVPVGFFLLSVFILLHLSGQCSAKSSRGLLVLAGLAAGFMVWTKHDGFWLVLALLLARAIMVVAANGWTAFIREALCLAAGLLPPILVALHFNLGLPQLQFLFAAPQPSGVVQSLAEPIRLLLIVRTFVETVVSFSGGAVAVLVVLILVCGKVVGESDRTDVMAFCVFLLFSWGGIVACSLVAPADAGSGIERWLPPVMERLLLQLWPSVLFFTFLIANLPRRPREFQMTDAEAAG
jgi:hypothetical protein